MPTWDEAMEMAGSVMGPGDRVDMSGTMIERLAVTPVSGCSTGTTKVGGVEWVVLAFRAVDADGGPGEWMEPIVLSREQARRLLAVLGGAVEKGGGEVADLG